MASKKRKLDFVCCDTQIDNSFMFKNHFLFGTKHFDGKRVNDSFFCPVIDCDHNIKFFKNLKQHFKSFHRSIYNKVFIGPSSYQDDNRNITDDQPPVKKFKFDNQSFDNESIIDQHHLYESDRNQDMFKQDLMQLLIENKLKHIVPEKVVCNIAHEVINLFLKYNDEYVLDREMMENGSRLTKSTYYLNLKINELTKNQLSEVPIVGESLVGKRSFYYCSLRNLIEKNLQKDEIIDDLMKTREQKRDREVLRSYKDGELYEEEEEDEIELQIYLSIDDFNPLDSNSPGSSSHKQTAIYFSIGNYSYSNQSSRDDIFVLALINREDLNEIGIEKLFDPLINEIEEIESNPIVLKNGMLCKIGQVSLCADNLGANEILNITRCFKSRACKYCTIPYKKLQDPSHYLKKRKQRDHSRRSLVNKFKNKLYIMADCFHDIHEGK